MENIENKVISIIDKSRFDITLGQHGKFPATILCFTIKEIFIFLK